MKSPMSIDAAKSAVKYIQMFGDEGEYSFFELRKAYKEAGLGEPVLEKLECTGTGSGFNCPICNPPDEGITRPWAVVE